MSKERLCGDVLVIPTPMSGHVNPTMYIARSLMDRGLSVTVVIRRRSLSLLDKYTSDESLKGLLNVPVLPEEQKGGPGGGRGGGGGRGREKGGDDAPHGERGSGGGRGKEKGGDDAPHGERRSGGGRGREKGEDDAPHGERRSGGGRVKEKSGDDAPGGGRGAGAKGKGGGDPNDSPDTTIEDFLKKVLAEQKASGQGPKCMIADQFLGWTHSWSKKLDIPRYIAMCSPATFAYFQYMYSSLIDDGLLENGEEDPTIRLPGIQVLHLSDMPDQAKANPLFVTGNGDTFGESAGILFNTFYELEANAIEAFHAQLKSNTAPGQQVPKLLSVGPMLPDNFFSEETFTSKSGDSECIEWLNTRPAESVLYIAFGSNKSLTFDEAHELAGALEACKQSFLWVFLVQAPKGRGTEKFNETEEVTKLLPPGFQERTKDRGFIYPKFAPQLEILSNPATGGFLSHCGWNSSLESIARGVPTLAWPMGAEQNLCCRILVDEVKVTVEVKPGLKGNHEVIDKAFFEKAIRRLMIDPEGKEIKKNAKAVQKQARTAMSPHGSSQKNIAILVEDIKSL